MNIGYVMQLGVDLRVRPFTGQATHVREVVSELRALGHRVRIVVRLDGTTYRTDDFDGLVPVATPGLDRGPARLFERIVRRIQRELRLPYAGIFDNLRFASACREELRGFDVVYERFSWMGYGASIASRRLGIPFVIEDNGDHLADLESKGMAPKGLQRSLSLFLMRTAVRRAAMTISTGDGWRKRFLERWGLPADRVCVVENGTALLKMLERGALKSFRDPDPPGEAATLIYVGGFDPWHGISVLLNAVVNARQAGARLRVVLIGSGFGLPAARKLVTELGLGDHVVFTGQLPHEEIAKHLCRADVGLSPYCGWKEYSGLKLFDYKAAGLPTIASGENGQPATLEHGRTGWIVPPCNEAALTDAILKLSGDVELRRRMGRAAREEAETRHGWNHTAIAVESVLRQAIAAAGSPTGNRTRT
jgi:glycosyltransferase involved in cell wall biosynthesis